MPTTAALGSAPDPGRLILYSVTFCTVYLKIKTLRVHYLFNNLIFKIKKKRNVPPEAKPTKRMGGYPGCRWAQVEVLRCQDPDGLSRGTWGPTLSLVSWSLFSRSFHPLLSPAAAGDGVRGGFLVEAGFSSLTEPELHHLSRTVFLSVRWGSAYLTGCL